LVVIWNFATFAGKEIIDIVTGYRSGRDDSTNGKYTLLYNIACITDVLPHKKLPFLSG
jgi:hypothetical protein